MPKILALFALVLVCACGNASSDQPDPGGSSNPDGGSRKPDAGPKPPEKCSTEGAQEACQGSSEGGCDPGLRTCTGGVWGPCEGRVQPAPGLCDQPSCAGGENPGCECRLNDPTRSVRECYSGPDTALGNGPCVKGVQSCVATATGSAWGPCQGEVLPAQDDCTSRELDCDRSKTPACTCTAGQERPCGGVSGGSCQLGTQKCESGKWGECTGEVQPVPGDCSQESCAGGPNPGCECVTGTSEPCYTGLFGTEGVGTCKAGTRTCQDGRWSQCTGQERPLRFCENASCTGTPLPFCE